MGQIIGASRPHTTMLLNRLERRGAIQRLKPRGVMVCPAELKRILNQGRARAA
jgi:DNA-binding GntR family transcriptional regulator